MGVKDLWGIIAPVGHHASLKNLSGQTLAVDLSIWVCETQGVKKMHGVVTKPHLRNLFFRISHLSQLGVKLVFAIEGTAPDLKLETMSKRQNSQFAARSARAQKTGNRAKKPTRSHFNSVLRECCEMLECLGIPYVQSQGEAEAMCAVLNSEGLVDGCLTNDGDAFLYGARVIYRNFTMNTKDPHVDVFRMDDLEQELGLNREKLVAMAILLGCDYMPQGVPGVGRELAGKLMQALDGVEVLKRMEQWRTDHAWDDLETHTGQKKASHCVCCNHPGSQRHHDRWGCSYCGSDKSCVRHSSGSCPCDWHKKQHQVELRAAEFSVRQKAMKLPNFPPKTVINEFMQTKDKVSALSLAWKQPKLFQFQRFCSLKMEWEEEYSLAKLLPLLTLHDMTVMLHSGVTPSIQPHTLIKSRVRQGVPCYEIAWNKLVGDTTTQTEFYMTLESQELFARCFPLIVEQFEQELSAKRKTTSRGKSKKKATDILKQSSDDDIAVTDVTSELCRLRILTDDAGAVDSRDVIPDASIARPWMRGKDREEEEQHLGDSCVRLHTPGSVVGPLGNSPDHVRLQQVPMCDSYLTEVPVTDVSNANELKTTGEKLPCGRAEEYTDDDDDDDDVFLPLSERLRKQKRDAGRKPVATSLTQDGSVVSVSRTASSSSATIEPISDSCDMLTERQNYNVATSELSIMTNQLPSTTQQLYLAARYPQIKEDNLFKSSQFVKQPTEDKSPKASRHPICTSQEISAGRHFDGRYVGATEQIDVSLDMQQKAKDTQQETLVDHLCEKSDLVIVSPLEISASGAHSNVHQMSGVCSDSCTDEDDKLGGSSDIQEYINFTEQQLDVPLQPPECTETNILSKFCAEEGDHCQPTCHCSSSRSVEKTRKYWASAVIMSPNLFDSSCDDDDDNSLCASTLTPPVGTTWNIREKEQSPCAINQWDVETPHVFSAWPGVGHDGAEENTDDGVNSETSRLSSSVDDSAFSSRSIPDNQCSPVLKPTDSAYCSSIEKTALYDSAFVSCSSSTACTGSNFTHTHRHSQTLGDSLCGSFGDFKLRSSLLYESDYLSDSTDFDDSVFICALEPSATDDAGNNYRRGSSSSCSSNLDNNVTLTCQRHCHDVCDTSTQSRQGHSNIVLRSSPTMKRDILATSYDISTANCDNTSQQVNSPVCLADRLKLRLAKTNKAHLLSCLSSDSVRTGT